MGFALGGTPIWPIAPDWTNGVRETLAWSTEIHMASATAVTEHVARRIGPRRAFVFDVLQAGAERRIADMLLADRGARPWRLPVWPDLQRLRVPVAAEATVIPCSTQGYDFVAGGEAVLYRGVRNWEVVRIDSVDAGGLALEAPVTGHWPAGTQLYPVRRARIEGNAQLRTITEGVSRAALRFRIDEPCDWPAALPEVEYLGRPVMLQVPDVREAGTVTYERTEAGTDDGAGAPVVFDVAGVALRSTPHAWELWGRAQNAGFRSLLYGLRGRQVPVWVPSESEDLRVVAPIAAASALLTVEWCGYTLYGRVRPNRRDILIELHDGTLFFRRITGAADAGDTEVLQLSTPLGIAVAPGAVRRVAFMTLSTLASDEVEIHHHTGADGRSRAVAPWKAVVPDA